MMPEHMYMYSTPIIMIILDHLHCIMLPDNSASSTYHVISTLHHSVLYILLLVHAETDVQGRIIVLQCIVL